MAPPEETPRRDTRLIARMIGVGVVASVLGIALGLLIDWFPVQASTQAKDIDTLYDVLIIASVPMFVLVTVVVLFAATTFKMKPGQEDQDGPPIHGNTKLEVIWTTIPAIMMVALCTYAYVVLRDIERKPAEAAQELKVQVLGQQFAWSFTYPREEGGGKQVTSNDLVLPIGRSVEFKIQARDVIHDFFVPEFRLKMDAVPGVTTHYRVTPNRIGTYPVICAELCGLGHSTMRSSVRVVSPEDFTAWLKEKTAPPAGAGAGADPAKQATAGKEVFAGSAGCGGCHTLADAGTTGQTGPNLGASLKGKDPDYIKQAIIDPNAALAKGFGRGIMPGNYEQSLSADEVNALVTYLAKVTK